MIPQPNSPTIWFNNISPEQRATLYRILMKVAELGEQTESGSDDTPTNSERTSAYTEVSSEESIVHADQHQNTTHYVSQV